MGEHDILRRLLRIAIRETTPNSARAESVLAWCRNNDAFLGLPDLSKDAPDEKTEKRKKRSGKRKGEPKPLAPWERLRRSLTADPAASGAIPLSPPLATAGRLANLLSLPPKEAHLLETAVAVNRLQRVSTLLSRMRAGGLDYGLIVSELAGLDTIDDVAGSQVARLGLVELSTTRAGDVSVDLTDALGRALLHNPVGDDSLIECLVGTWAASALCLDDFIEHAETVDLIRRMLAGALENGAVGVNILFHGPPGTGKTELAKVLAAACGAQIFSVGEADDYGDEPSRWDRVTSLKLAQRVFANRRDTILLFDEMEDLIGEVARGEGGRHFSRRDGSKVFVNRLLETNPVPTMWTSNAIDNVDTSFMRRMSFVMSLDAPPRSARVRIISRIAEAEGMAMTDAAIGRFADFAPEATSVARTAVRTARLAGGGEADAGTVMSALVTGMRYGRCAAPARHGKQPLDLDLYESRPAIPELFRRMTAPGAPLDFSLLMTGPPGTGKTALAHHLARCMDRPLVVKRASDIMSKWIGETERRIADAFAQAAETGSVLLVDEIDSLLYDRSTAERSWEVSQVNELLTWLDHHPMPFVAATNHAARLDPAAPRRFDFKLALEALTAEKSVRAFRRFFGIDAPAGLADIEGLTPGDFAVVARQLRFYNRLPDPTAIVGLLSAEAAAKPHRAGKIGFRPS
jgi:SpoVK/Ycf46/Vps4 family AAA+-type ATPase